MTALTHLTLTTGHARQSPRAEVADDIVALLRPIVRAGVGELRGLHIRVATRGRGGRWFRLGWEPDTEAAAVHCVVCWDPARHDYWWRSALAHWQVASADLSSPRAFQVPTVPWLTAEILPAAVRCSRSQMAQLGDAERCVAWALLEERGGDGHAPAR